MRLLPTTLWLFVAVHIEAQQAQQLPTAIRKMTPDNGEKFFPEYYAFANEGQSGEYAQVVLAAQQDLPRDAALARRVFDEEDDRLLAANAFAQLYYRPPFAPHTFSDEDDLAQQRRISGSGESETDGPYHAWDLFRRRADALGQLDKRQWACPNGTSNCSSIGYPDSCCSDGETCVVVTDTGLGSVGCCPSGSTCGGTVGNCASGSTACSSSEGGGCCIAGYVCEGVGCVQSSSTTSATGVVTLSSTSTSVVTSPTLSTVIVTVIVTITPSQSQVTSTTTQTVGGGGGGGGGSGASTATQTTSGADSGAVPPVRPTSSTPNTYCPTGFYACVASAGGGCCQTGRDCNTTSCPAATYTTIVNSNGVTVVVPESGLPAATTGTCASGWFLCGTTAGTQAGCCPSGYNCGTASCSLVTVGGTATIAKEPPVSAAARGAALGSKWMAGVMLPVVLLFSTMF